MKMKTGMLQNQLVTRCTRTTEKSSISKTKQMQPDVNLSEQKKAEQVDTLGHSYMAKGYRLEISSHFCKLFDAK